MKLKIMGSLLMVLVVIYVIYPWNREFDSFSTIDNFAISSQIQASIVRLHTNLNIKSNYFSLTFKNKTVIQTSNSFLRAYNNSGSVNSHGDSFYHIEEKSPSMLCEQMVIQEVHNLSKRIQILGTYQECQQITYKILISLDKRENLNIKLVFDNDVINRIIFQFFSSDAETFYGLGEQFSHLQLEDLPYSLFVREKGIGRTEQPLGFIVDMLYKNAGSYDTTYSPSPIWISSRNLGYIANTTCYTAWHQNHIYVWANSALLTIISQPSAKGVVSEIAEYNGYTEVLPDWVNKGAIVGLQGGSRQVQIKFTKLDSFNCSISGIWMQDWVSKRMSRGYSRLWWNWQLDNTHYPMWQDFREGLKQKNINVLIYVNPMLTNVEEKNYYNFNYYKYAASKGYLVRDKFNNNFMTSASSDFKAGIIDLYNPQAKAFYKLLIENIIDETSAKGMMVDFGQQYPVENMTDSLQRTIQKHNLYPVEWLKLVHEVLEKKFGSNNDFFTFSRSSYLHSPRYTRSLWAGDQNMNFGRHNGLKSCLVAMLSSGLVGYSNTHCDIGGYVHISLFAVRSEILMIRWMGLAAFSPVFRTHQGNMPNQSLQVYSNQNMLKHFSFYSNLYSALYNYRKSQMIRSSTKKLPLMRPLFLELQHQDVKSIWDQYFLGEDLLISPLLDSGNSREIYLPAGDWVDIWTKQEISGCNCKIMKNSDLPIVYVKSNSVHRMEILIKVEKLLKQQTVIELMQL